MATELTVQSERAYQKQPHIFLNQKLKAAKSKKVGKGGRRWFKDVGLGFRTPKTAVDGSYIGECNPVASRHDDPAEMPCAPEMKPNTLGIQTRNVPSPAWSPSEDAS